MVARTVPDTQQQDDLKPSRGLEVVQNNALRGTLPVYRTTLVPTLHRETAIPPIQGPQGCACGPLMGPLTCTC
jgi:hypothetical protein